MVAAFALSACTYGPAEDRVKVNNVALKPDGSLAAVVVRYERSRPATGLSAFPDGGTSRVLLQRVDFYVVSVDKRALLYRSELTPHPGQRVAFEPWLLGWAGETVYLQIQGCPGTPGDECHGPLRTTSLYSWVPGAALADATTRPVVILTSRINHPPSGFLEITREPYGVGISTRIGATAAPLLHFNGLQLEVVP